MELSVVLVLTLVTLGTATPHGYGVKGGASAKAEASAVAGAFGDLGGIPLSIPPGSAYSGSFSKSSSSSFASSSASASSSSYSFSGSGTNGIGDIGTTGLGQKGCSSGSCPGGAANGADLNGGQQFGGANAVASAQAKALAGAYAPCQGAKCNSSPNEKCSSGQCPQDSEKKSGCSSGNCQSDSDNDGAREGDLSTNKDKHEEDGNNSNDFAVNIYRDSQAKSSQGSSNQYSNKQNPSGPYCSNGKCGSNSYPSDAANKPNGQPAPATYLTTPNHNEPCTSPNCNNYPSQGNGPYTSGLPSSYNVPLQSATNPPNQFYSPSGSNFGAPGYTNKETQNTPSVPCTSPNCNPAGPSNVPNFGKEEPNNGEPCVSGRCNLKPSNNGGVSGTTSPSFSNNGYNSNVQPGYSGQPGYTGQPGCNSPNCGKPSSNQPYVGSSTVPKYPAPGHSSLPTNNQDNDCGGRGCAGTPYSGASTKPSHKDAPVYTGGFGGPAGILDIGVNRPSPNTGTNTQFNPNTGFDTPTASTVPQGYPTHPNSNGISSGSNTNTRSYTNSGTNSVHGSFGVTKPNLAPNAQSSPTYTGGFGGPQGTITKPSSSFGTHPTAHKPGTGNCGYSGCNQQPNSNDKVGTAPYDTNSRPTHSDSFGGPSGPINGPSSTLGAPGSYKPGSSNCGLSGCNGQPDSNNNIGTSPYNTNKPQPTYTGGFGGSSGSIDGSSLTHGSAGSYNPGSSNCGLSGCNGQPGSNNNIDTSPHDTKKPQPTYTGGFGGPSGSIHGSSSVHGSAGAYPKPGTANCGLGGCQGQPESNGITGISQPNGATPSQTKPDYTGDFGKPTGTDGSSPTFGSSGAYKPVTANCGQADCSGKPGTSSNDGKAPYDTTNSKPSYTGGFGGPTGPSGSTLGSPEINKSGSANCGAAGCNGQDNSNGNGAATSHDIEKPGVATSSQTKPTYSGGFGGPTGFLKPNDYSAPTSSSGSTPCTSGSCPKGAPSTTNNQGHSITGSQSLASASASANAVAYSGGFGGPPGVLKPFDDGKVNSPAHGNSGITNSPSLGAPLANGKNSLSGDSLNGGNAGAQASASATASARSYSPNNNGQNNNGAPTGCNSGCPNNGDGSHSLGSANAGAVASAKSVAGANSFGYGGSFASSSASAHASAGAATKGGYGRK